jgi:hypothetical protein
MWKVALVLALVAVMAFGVFLIFGPLRPTAEGPRYVMPTPTTSFERPAVPAMPLGEEPVPGTPYVQPTKPPVVETSPYAVVERGSFTVSGPFTYQNLAVFLLHGADRLVGKDFLTLEEALQTGQAVVHDTRRVNLDVENRSPSQDVFVPSGVILKGGTQDRLVPYDLIAAAGSGRVPLPAFCVEQGRSQPRGDESATSFTVSNGCSCVPARDIKLAAMYEHSQQHIWNGVVATQDKLRRSLGTDLPTASPSSLQLTLDTFAVREAVGPYVEALSGTLKGKKEVIGFACVVNGKITSAEVYGSAALFAKLWPKLLRASAVEALAERPSADGSAPASVAVVQDFLADAEGGRARTQALTDRLTQVMQETDRGLLFETRDYYHGEGWVHRSYLMK